MPRFGRTPRLASSARDSRRCADLHADLQDVKKAPRMAGGPASRAGQLPDSRPRTSDSSYTDAARFA